jgi:hypothetical protein
MQTKNIARIVLVTAFMLLIPLAAMQFTDDVNWKLADFVVAGVLLFGTGIALELSAKKLTSPVKRVISAVAIVAMVLIIWAELAVGIAGSPFAGS